MDVASSGEGMHATITTPDVEKQGLAQNLSIEAGIRILDCWTSKMKITATRFIISWNT